MLVDCSMENQFERRFGLREGMGCMGVRWLQLESQPSHARENIYLHQNLICEQPIKRKYESSTEQ